MKGSLAYFWSDRSKIYIRTEENTTRRGSARDFNPADMSKRKTQGGSPEGTGDHATGNPS